MTPQAQRIAIAEACGWTLKPDAYRDWWYPPKENASPRTELPDFPNDLNAMHEAEETLSAEQYSDTLNTGSYYSQQMRYSAHLSKIVLPYDPLGSLGKANLFAILNSSAAQRAEAFLRTLGEWE